VTLDTVPKGMPGAGLWRGGQTCRAHGAASKPGLFRAAKALPMTINNPTIIDNTYQ